MRPADRRKLPGGWDRKAQAPVTAQAGSFSWAA